MNKTYWYEVDENNRFPLDAIYDLDDDTIIDCFVGYCAGDYYYNHDGWEDTWPVKISIAETENGQTFASYIVELETEPVFYAERIADES
jgi:hypothetical protein